MTKGQNSASKQKEKGGGDLIEAEEVEDGSISMQDISDLLK